MLSASLTRMPFALFEAIVQPMRSTFPCATDGAARPTIRNPALVLPPNWQPMNLMLVHSTESELGSISTPDCGAVPELLMNRQLTAVSPSTWEIDMPLRWFASQVTLRRRMSEE